MNPTAANRTPSLWVAASLLILVGAAIGLAACQAATGPPAETKRGAIGEYCNGPDSQCRTGYICQSGVCVIDNQRIDDACKQICERIENCGALETSCLPACYRELGGNDHTGNWGDEAIDIWADCLVNDLTCAQIGGSSEQAAQICFDRLPLADDRGERCQKFKRQGGSCSPSGAPADFGSECRYRARTASDQRWAETDSCAQSMRFGDNCEELTACLNRVFSLEGDQQAF